MSTWLERTRSKLRELWRRAKSERATPRQIAWAVAVGVFTGCTPAVGFHGWLAVGVATLLRLNRLFAFIGSRVSNFLIIPWITLAELQVGHRLRTGEGLEISAAEALRHGPTLLVDWCIGAVPVGLGLAVVLGVVAYAVAKRRRPDEALRPSSESPP